MNFLSKALNKYVDFIDFEIKSYDFRTNGYAIARSFLVIGTLITMALNDATHLFNPTNSISPNILYVPFNKISIFYLLKDHLSIAKSLAILILLVTLSGYKPRYTCVLHWWVSFSLAISSFVLEGGDHVTQVLTLLLIPICLSDNRSNHWKMHDDRFKNNIVTLFSYFLIRLQVAYIYLEASLGKLKVEEWRDGTALYYWLKNNFIGSPKFLNPIVEYIITSPILITVTTWSGILIEFSLFMCISSFKNHRIIFLWLGFLFHFIIFLSFGLFSFMFAMSAALILYLFNFKNKIYVESSSSFTNIQSDFHNILPLSAKKIKSPLWIQNKQNIKVERSI